MKSLNTLENKEVKKKKVIQRKSTSNMIKFQSMRDNVHLPQNITENPASDLKPVTKGKSFHLSRNMVKQNTTFLD